MKTPNEKIADIVDGLLDSILKNLTKTATKFNSKSVPLELVKQFHDVAKKSYREGITNQKKKK